VLCVKGVRCTCGNKGGSLHLHDVGYTRSGLWLMSVMHRREDFAKAGRNGVASVCGGIGYEAIQ